MVDRQRRPQRFWMLPAMLGCLNFLCIGISALASGLLPWPFSFGLVLFCQVFLFMMICIGLARQTPLHADHRSFRRDMTPAAIIAEMERARRRLLAFELVAGALAIALAIGHIVMGGLSDASVFGNRGLSLSLIQVALALGVALLAHSATLARRNSPIEYVRQSGVPATARVLSVAKGRGSQLSAFYDPARRYQLELEVTPRSGEPYRVSFQQAIRKHPSTMPAPGESIPVRYHPEQPELVVGLLDPEPRRPAPAKESTGP